MLGFCEKCRDMVECHIKEEKMIKNIKGKEIEYIGKLAFCNECGSEMFIANIRDHNLRMLDKAFREKEGLITIPEMELILKNMTLAKGLYLCY